MKEIWKDIKGYEGAYKVSSLGRIKSLKFNKTLVMKDALGSNGYKSIALSLKGVRITYSVHVIVAIAFLNHTPCGRRLVVNHINFNKLDNRVENLEIVTMRKNSNKKHLESGSTFTGVNWHKGNGKWVSQISFNGKQKHLGYFKCELAAAQAYDNKLRELY